MISPYQLFDNDISVSSGVKYNVLVQRKTTQRQSVRDALANAGRPLDAQEALEQARQLHPGIGIATVYRALADLLEEGWLKKVELPGEPLRYELADLGHHHHFHCRSCGRVFDVPGCGLVRDPHVEAGFRVDGHEVILYGKCPDCV